MFSLWRRQRSPAGASPDARLRARGLGREVPKQVTLVAPTGCAAGVLSETDGVGAEGAARALVGGTARLLQPRRAAGTPLPREPVVSSSSEEDDAYDSVSDSDDQDAGGSTTGADEVMAARISGLAWANRVRRVAFVRWRAALAMGQQMGRLRRGRSAAARAAAKVMATAGGGMVEEEMAARVADGVVAAIARPLALEMAAFRAAAEASRAANEERIADLADRLEGVLRELAEERKDRAGAAAPPKARRSSSLPHATMSAAQREANRHRSNVSAPPGVGGGRLHHQPAGHPYSAGGARLARASSVVPRRAPSALPPAVQSSISRPAFPGARSTGKAAGVAAGAAVARRRISAYRMGR